MSPNKASCSRVKVTELQEFLRDPPPGFLVEPLEGDSCGYRVHNCRTFAMGGVWRRNVQHRNSTVPQFSPVNSFLLVRTLSCVCVVPVVNQYVVCINGSDPLIKWQMARGLDWTISSVAGESYTVEVRTLLWATTNSHVCTDKLIKAEPVWRDAAFTLKYHSDALFDFPYWFGFSKRSFKVIPGWSSLFLLANKQTDKLYRTKHIFRLFFKRKVQVH
uniref:Mesenteric estrogen dependent adipogenesis n=1 Tax=Cynoglossus semilaevis TaxID=244447 RepID=A0A3P8W2E3_CYNSE